MKTYTFTKMQGLGNDFVVIDATSAPFQLTTAQIQQMANRRLGVGFDQLLVIEPPKEKSKTDFHFRIFNADGGEVGQCGNGARCIALYIKEKKLSDKSQFLVSTLSDVLTLQIVDGGKVKVNMGVPRFSPQDIPFQADTENNSYPIKLDELSINISVVNVGNPHAIIQVNPLTADDVSVLGKQLSTHPLFPEGTNVGFMQCIDDQHIRLRVYERGTGATLACGSGACAAMVVGRRNGLLQERVVVNQPGGSLEIDWAGPGSNIEMTGPAKLVYEGQWQI